MAFKMYTFVVVVLGSLLQSNAAIITKYVHCMDIKGSAPEGSSGWGWGGDNDESIASCPSSGNYIMTSCSARVNGSARIMGGVIDNAGSQNECIAYTDDGESYNQAIARCCNLTGLILSPFHRHSNDYRLFLLSITKQIMDHHMIQSLVVHRVILMEI